MDYILILKILTEWSINSKEYELLNFIYSNFNIGIPNRFLYKLPDHNIFYSLSSFNSNNDLKKIEDKNLEQLFYMFKKSKYTRLEYWNNSQGYKIIN
jgi:hypothetical protein